MTKRASRIFALATVLLVASSTGAFAESRDEWQQPDKVITDLHLRPGSVIADVGCGSGYFTYRLANAVGASGKVYAVDINASALASINQTVNHDSITNITTVLSGNTDTKLDTGSLDAVFFCNVFHEVPKDVRPGLIQDTVRALKPGGYVFLLDWRKSHEVTGDPYERLIPRDELVEMCEKAGLVLDAEYHYLKLQVFFRLRKNTN
jgi:arsenite methyltransferase